MHLIIQQDYTFTSRFVPNLMKLWNQQVIPVQIIIGTFSKGLPIDLSTNIPGGRLSLNHSSTPKNFLKNYNRPLIPYCHVNVHIPNFTYNGCLNVILIPKPLINSYSHAKSFMAKCYKHFTTSECDKVLSAYWKISSQIFSSIMSTTNMMGANLEIYLLHKKNSFIVIGKTCTLFHT